MSEANVQNAAGVYVVAASHYYEVSLNAINQPNRMNVEEVAEDTFRIMPPNWEDEEDAVPLAVCRWDEDDQLWEVQVGHELPSVDDSDIVQVAWNEDSEEYDVVE